MHVIEMRMWASVSVFRQTLPARWQWRTQNPARQTVKRTRRAERAARRQAPIPVQTLILSYLILSYHPSRWCCCCLCDTRVAKRVCYAIFSGLVMGAWCVPALRTPINTGRAGVGWGLNGPKKSPIFFCIFLTKLARFVLTCTCVAQSNCISYW